MQNNALLEIANIIIKHESTFPFFTALITSGHVEIGGLMTFQRSTSGHVEMEDDWTPLF